MYGLPDSFTGNFLKKAYKKVKYAGGRAGSARDYLGVSYRLNNIILYKSEIRRILNTPAGKLWWALERRGDAIVRDAKRQVGVKTGALKASIHKRHLGNATGQYLWIGSKKSYAYMHHEGTRPHTITPSKAPALVFRSGARIIRTPIVEHPGTRANRYLSTPMRKHIIRPINIR